MFSSHAIRVDAGVSPEEIKGHRHPEEGWGAPSGLQLACPESPHVGSAFCLTVEMLSPVVLSQTLMLRG